jgi:hypothetical protein
VSGGVVQLGVSYHDFRQSRSDQVAMAGEPTSGSLLIRAMVPSRWHGVPASRLISQSSNTQSSLAGSRWGDK